MSRTLLTSAIALASVVTSSSPLLAAFTEKDSAEFSNKYEMIDNTGGLSTAGSTTTWTRNPGGGGSSPVDSLTGGSLLWNTSLAASRSLYFQTTPAAWGDVSNASTGWTVEVRVRVDTAAPDNASVNVYVTGQGENKVPTTDRVFDLVVGDNTTTAFFRVGLNSVITSPGFGATLVDTSNNTDDYHVFRIAKDNSGLNRYRAWRDGVPLTELGTLDFSSGGSQQDAIYFLDGTGGYGGSGAVDYIRYDLSGGFSPAVPEPASASLLGLGAMLVLRRRK